MNRDSHIAPPTPMHDAGEDRHRPAADHHAHEIPLRRAERCADAQLLRAFRRDERQHAVDPGAGQQHREQREAAEQIASAAVRPIIESALSCETVIGAIEHLDTC